MTTFDDRAKAYEDKFAHDNELEFKINARRNHLFGLWAAGRLRLPAEDVYKYADDILNMNIEKKNTQQLINKVLDDFVKADIIYTAEDLSDMLEEFSHTARQQILGE